MSRRQGKRPTSGKAKGKGRSSAKRPPDREAVRRFGLLAFGASFAVLFGIVAIAEGIGHPSVPAGDVAIVEDVPGDAGTIERADFERGLAQAAAQAGLKKVPKPKDAQYAELRETALTGLLDIAWVRGEAAEMGTTVSDKEVARELKKLKDQSFKSEAEYREFLEESNLSKDQVDEQVELQILSRQIEEGIVEGAPAPSQGEVERYYAGAKSTQFTQQETRDVRTVVNKDRKKAERAKALLEKDDSAKSWKRVARKFSEGKASKKNGGLQRAVTEETLEGPLGEAVFETPEKRVEGPIKTDQGFQVFEVENTTPEEVQPLTDVEAQIQSQLEQQAQQEAFAEFIEDFTAKWSARTFCAPRYAISRCANFSGDVRPETAPPACYEAEPETAPEACPAPVFQLIPAQPGSVSVLQPKGTPLAQRPRPAGLEETEGEAGLPGGLQLPPGVQPPVE